MTELKENGFTLVEIMIVVAIIALISAIGIPNLLRARINTNENAACATLNALSTALHTFRASNSATGFPADLTGLAPGGGEPPYIVSTLCVAAPSRNGYNFAYTPGGGNPRTQYHIFASPTVANITGVRGFYIDEQGFVSAISPAGDDPGHAADGEDCPDGYARIE